MEEIKKSLNFMSEEISKMVKQQATLTGLKGEQCELRTMIEQRDQKIELLEQRVKDLEQYIRAGDITTTGLETKHRSYARATVPETAGEDAPPEELQTLEDQVLAFLNNKNIMIEKKHISACHTLSGSRIK